MKPATLVARPLPRETVLANSAQFRLPLKVMQHDGCGGTYLFTSMKVGFVAEPAQKRFIVTKIDGKTANF